MDAPSVVYYRKKKFRFSVLNLSNSPGKGPSMDRFSGAYMYNKGLPILLVNMYTEPKKEG